MFKNVIVRRPGRSLAEGITSAPELGKPDYELALKQHDAYIKALEECGVKVTVLEALEEYPDSCFVEDTAVLTKRCAIISNPGASTRRGESVLMIDTIKKFYSDDQIEYITSPGAMEGGDVMMVGNHFYIGLSARTNEEGCRQFKEALEKYGHTCSVVSLEEVLHLKTGVNYIENNNMLVSGEFIEKEDFKSFNKIIVPENEAYGANCIWINDIVIVPEGYPTVEKGVRDAGYKVIVLDTSEYKKLDGGLSCLSLRF
ncbi:arginine deiminase family protein [Sedimentibacter sp.]|uniref:dimethylarginine dimethylaminohydrolase family protein n=1 Tax=Sedimentibacter sp. TaxID=1960295 RepID=UPI0028A14813|nr:arginine deiminase family protein [Sedimentibacter sp.]